MSERLTETALYNLDAYLDARKTGAIGVEVRQALRMAIAELRTHRAEALTSEEREALRHARYFVAADLCGEERCQSSACQRNDRALAVLDRLIGQGEKR